jgi:hypothetical protein
MQMDCEAVHVFAQNFLTPRPTQAMAIVSNSSLPDEPLGEIGIDDHYLHPIASTAGTPTLSRSISLTLTT